jgi:hypothetical protein
MLFFLLGDLTVVVVVLVPSIAVGTIDAAAEPSLTCRGGNDNAAAAAEAARDSANSRNDNSLRRNNRAVSSANMSSVMLA